MRRQCRHDRQSPVATDPRRRDFAGWALRRVRCAQGGDVNVWIADSNGGNLRQLTTGNADQSATFSADGRFVYYQHWSEGTVHLYRVPLSGGARPGF